MVFNMETGEYWALFPNPGSVDAGIPRHEVSLYFTEGEPVGPATVTAGGMPMRAPTNAFGDSITLPHGTVWVEGDVLEKGVRFIGGMAPAQSDASPIERKGGIEVVNRVPDTRGSYFERRREYRWVSNLGQRLEGAGFSSKTDHDVASLRAGLFDDDDGGAGLVARFRMPAGVVSTNSLWGEADWLVNLQGGGWDLALKKVKYCSECEARVLAATVAVDLTVDGQASLWFRPFDGGSSTELMKIEGSQHSVVELRLDNHPVGREMPVGTTTPFRSDADHSWAYLGLLSQYPAIGRLVPMEFAPDGARANNPACSPYGTCTPKDYHKCCIADGDSKEPCCDEDRMYSPDCYLDRP